MARHSSVLARAACEHILQAGAVGRRHLGAGGLHFRPYLLVRAVAPLRQQRAKLLDLRGREAGEPIEGTIAELAAFEIVVAHAAPGRGGIGVVGREIHEPELALGAGGAGGRGRRQSCRRAGGRGGLGPRGVELALQGGGVLLGGGGAIGRSAAARLRFAQTRLQRIALLDERGEALFRLADLVRLVGDAAQRGEGEGAGNEDRGVHGKKSRGDRATRRAGQGGAGDAPGESRRHARRRLGREGRGERRARGRDTPAREQHADFFQRAVDAHARRILAYRQLGPQGGKRPPPEEAQQHRLSIGWAQRAQRLVDHGAHAVPVAGGHFGRQFLHGVGLLLALSPAAVRPHRLRRRVMRAQVEPAGERAVPHEPRRLAGEIGENALRHILRQMRIAADVPQRRGIHHAEVALDQRGKGRLGIFTGVALQKFEIGGHADALQAAAEAKTEQAACCRRAVSFFHPPGGVRGGPAAGFAPWRLRAMPVAAGIFGFATIIGRRETRASVFSCACRIALPSFNANSGPRCAVSAWRGA